MPAEAPRVEPKKLSNDNAFSALESDSEEEDLSNMTLEQLKERAAQKNRKTEEETRKALAARDEKLKKVASHRPQAEEPVEEKPQLDLDKQWGVELPPRYCTVALVPLSEGKAQTVNTQVKQLFSTKRCNEMSKFLEDCNSMDVRLSRESDV